MPDVSEPATTVTLPRHRIVVPGSRIRVQDTDGEHEYTMVTRAAGDAAPGLSPSGLQSAGRCSDAGPASRCGSRRLAASVC
jgi:hypothetical protein